MKHWWVVSPEYGEVTPILDDGTGPMEYGCDSVCVDGVNKLAAIVAGVKKMRDVYANRGWHANHIFSTENPFKGMKAYSATCEHGVTCCDCEKNEADYCESCFNEGPRG